MIARYVLWFFYVLSVNLRSAVSDQISHETYQLSSEELSAFLDIRHSVGEHSVAHHDIVTRRSSDDISTPQYNQSLGKWIEHEVHTNALCPEHDYKDIFGFPRTYTFLKAHCIGPSKPRRFLLYCQERSVSWPHFNSIAERVEKFWHMCPRATTCHNWNIPIYEGLEEVGKYEDIECVPNSMVKIDNLAGVAARPSLHGPYVHCTEPQEIPGPSMQHVPWNPTGTELILTEEVTWSNGSNYVSPLLFIHDKTSKLFEFDRASRQFDSVVSAEIQVRPVRGRIPPRMIEFCMRLAVKTDVWVIMTYSWFTIPHRIVKINGDPVSFDR